MISVAEARAAILDGVAPGPAEMVGLAQKAGRVLAADLAARLTQPPFDTTAMDGYALRAADSDGRLLRVIGESSAGRRFDGALGPDEAVRIFTGAPLPPGADAVLRQEDARLDGDMLRAHAPVAVGRDVRRLGLDFRAGDVGLEAGRVLDARAIGLAAAMNHVALPVRRRPRIALLPTGDELVPPGAAPGPDQIVASSMLAVGALIQAAGGEPIQLGIAGDDLDVIGARIRAAAEAGADALVTLGGASVGDRDLVREAFADQGVELGFWRIAMRPGKPLAFGRRGAMRVIGLPGNPVSAYVCAVLFLVPFIRARLGLAPGPELARARLGCDLPANDAREDYLRATLEGAEPPVVTPFAVQDSSMQAALARADALLLRAPRAAVARAGDGVEIIRL